MVSNYSEGLSVPDFLKALFELLFWCGVFIQAVSRGRMRSLGEYWKFRKETYSPDSAPGARALVSFLSWSFDQRHRR
ncbi:MAG: hypothetical protein HKL83_01235 [Acidimicrobiaceae bacterium]|nr:hypothetical protein [Acidimicrobiaceae bacterium]